MEKVFWWHLFESECSECVGNGFPCGSLWKWKIEFQKSRIKKVLILLNAGVGEDSRGYNGLWMRMIQSRLLI